MNRSLNSLVWLLKISLLIFISVFIQAADRAKVKPTVPFVIQIQLVNTLADDQFEFQTNIQSRVNSSETISVELSLSDNLQLTRGLLNWVGPVEMGPNIIESIQVTKMNSDPAWVNAIAIWQPEPAIIMQVSDRFIISGNTNLSGRSLDNNSTEIIDGTTGSESERFGEPLFLIELP